ncbi:hypothetical protein J1N35_001989 [Gossypium stocksii]|uniref:Uncharacterized protein n=1 Tax=Gossypium stocksii TaxID=47602 RepID=A0A9D3WLH5_9ROSI|nr:hypothetical protein J1N35_001989 [Gossypium stocksii]
MGVEENVGAVLADDRSKKISNKESLIIRRKVRAVADIEEQLLTSIEKKSKAARIKRASKVSPKSDKIVNASSSDLDFLNRNRAIVKKAEKMWEMGKLLRLKAKSTEDDITNTMAMEDLNEC